MILLYDGDCGFCRWSAAQILRRTPTVTVTAIQSAEGQRLLAPIAPERRLATVHTAGPLGIASGGDAITEILGAMPHAGWLHRAARSMPGVIALAYNQIAARRRLLGKLVPAGSRAAADDYLRSATAPRSRPVSPRLP